MAALEKSGGSRTGSLSMETSHDGINSQTHLLHAHQNGVTEQEQHNSSLAALARRNTMRKRSFRYNKSITKLFQSYQKINLIFSYYNFRSKKVMSLLVRLIQIKQK